MQGRTLDLRKLGPAFRRILPAYAGIVSVALGLALGPTAPASSEPPALHVVANGEAVRLAGNVIVQDAIIMAPYQGLFEPLGIHPTWDPQARSLRLTGPGGDEMELRAGDPYVTINGERRPVPIPLVAVMGRVLIPVQWVFETFGDTAAYDAGSHTLVISPQITGVSWRGTDAGLEVTIDGTGPLHAAGAALHNPERVVVDIPGAVPKAAAPAFDVREGALTSIQIERSASGTRVVLDLLTPVPYRVSSEIPGRRVLVALGAALSPLTPTPGRASNYQPSGQKITSVLYQHVDGGGRLVISASRPLQTTQRILHDPERVVIDIRDAVFLPVKKSLDVEDGLVVQVRTAQFHSNPNVVRIVIELSRPVPFAVQPGLEAGQILVVLGTATVGGAGPATSGPAGPAPATAGRGPVVVALDAGHGGSDPGAIGPTGVQEKDAVLAITQALQRLLLQRHIDVIMIRDADVFVPLADRAQIAARGGATLFVSIHANASTDPNATGVQTFYADPASQSLAAMMLDEVCRGTGLARRGIIQAAFKVLVDSNRVPAILIETAFITNPREEQMLRDPAFQQGMAQSILKGVQRYLSIPQGAAP
jgi:N-acetylmuramoyl-L-alanine amidase